MRGDFVGDIAQIGGGIALQARDAAVGIFLAQAGEQRAAAHRRAGDFQRLAHLVGLVQNDLQVIGRARIGGACRYQRRRGPAVRSGRCLQAEPRRPPPARRIRRSCPRASGDSQSSSARYRPRPCRRHARTGPSATSHVLVPARFIDRAGGLEDMCELGTGRAVMPPNGGFRLLRSSRSDLRRTGRLARSARVGDLGGIHIGRHARTAAQARPGDLRRQLAARAAAR